MMYKQRRRAESQLGHSLVRVYVYIYIYVCVHERETTRALSKGSRSPVYERRKEKYPLATGTAFALGGCL